MPQPQAVCSDHVTLYLYLLTDVVLHDAFGGDGGGVRLVVAQDDWMDGCGCVDHDCCYC